VLSFKEVLAQKDGFCMVISVNPIDLLYLIIGIAIGLALPHGRRYMGHAYRTYRRRRYRY
jgi:hypothetical protein